MSDADGLLQDILANPDDDAPRLVYADWLEEHGEADRAEFIRAQIEAARLAQEKALRPALPVLFMSGYPGAPTQAPDPVLPPDATLLAKPFTIDRLLHAVVAAAGAPAS